MDDGGGGDMPTWMATFQSPFKRNRQLGSSSDDGSDDVDVIDIKSTQDLDAIVSNEEWLTPTKPTNQPNKKQKISIESDRKVTELDKTDDKEVTAQITEEQKDDVDNGSLTKAEAAQKGDAVQTEGNAQPISSCMEIVWPEKLQFNKILLEVDGDDGGPGDLGGDTGAVGRVLISGSKGSELLQLDLKGTILDGTIVPMAGTAMVVNMSKTQAKVEALFQELVQLRPQRHLEDAERVIIGDLGDWDLGGTADSDDDYPTKATKDNTKAQAKEGSDGEDRVQSAPAKKTKLSTASKQKGKKGSLGGASGKSKRKPAGSKQKKK